MPCTWFYHYCFSPCRVIQLPFNTVSTQRAVSTKHDTFLYKCVIRCQLVHIGLVFTFVSAICQLLFNVFCPQRMAALLQPFTPTSCTISCRHCLPRQPRSTKSSHVLQLLEIHRQKAASQIRCVVIARTMLMLRTSALPQITVLLHCQHESCSLPGARKRPHIVEVLFQLLVSRELSSAVIAIKILCACCNGH